jgi:hypothetical protein
MEYIESIGFTPKILNFFFAEINKWKKQYKKFRLSRAVAAAVDRNLCPTYSLDHKT